MPRSAPKWPAVNREQREAIVRDGGGLVDLWEDSVVRLEDNYPHTEKVIDTLFPGNPLLCVGRSSAEFNTRHRDAWRGQLANMQLIVPSPMSAQTGTTQEGKLSEHSLDNTGPRRFLVVEFDQGTADEHAALLLHLAERAPLALAVHSGSKSLHGWFYCVGQSNRAAARFHALRGHARCRSRDLDALAVCPDARGLRDNGKRQTVFFFNPEVVKK